MKKRKVLLAEEGSIGVTARLPRKRTQRFFVEYLPIKIDENSIDAQKVPFEVRDSTMVLGISAVRAPNQMEFVRLLAPGRLLFLIQ